MRWRFGWAQAMGVAERRAATPDQEMLADDVTARVSLDSQVVRRP